MSERDWKLYIEDILESISLIEEYVEGYDEEKFFNDRKTIDAVVRNLEIIGEAARNIPNFIKERYNNIDWRGMIGLRNRIAHGYFGLDLSIIWYIIKNELSPLKKELSEILDTHQ